MFIQRKDRQLKLWGLVLTVLLCTCGEVKAQSRDTPLSASGMTLPPNSVQYLPLVRQGISQTWPYVPFPAMLLAQVEQETCASLTSKKCWNPKTENINPKNNGEYGFGWGQLTNNNRYNNFEDVKKRFAGVRDWKWENRFDPAYQLRTMVYMDKAAFDIFKNAKDQDRMAFVFSAYNGGTGGVLQDRSLCRQLTNCDPEVWKENVEVHSHKQRTKLAGYRVSAFDINREYVRNIMQVRYMKYVPALAQAY